MSVIDIEADEPTVRDSALWVDRSAEARDLADFILTAKDGLVVLYGRYSVGKTTLIKRYVMRILPDDYETRFDDATLAIEEGIDAEGGRISLREALESKRIIFLDRFERYLAVSDDDGTSMQSMSEFLRSPERQGILILIMDDAGLEKVLAAAAYLPQLLSATREIHGVDLEHGCKTLLDNKEAGALDYDSEFLERLIKDARKLTQSGGGGGPDLLMALVEELRDLAAETEGACLTISVYENVGGVDGLLRRYMSHRIAGAFPENASARRIAKALMVEIAEQGEALGERLLTDISGRLDESYEECVEIQDKLMQKSGLLARSKNRPLQFVPSELRRIAGRLGEPSEKVQKAHETVEQGYDAWQRLGSPLPRDRFEQVDSVRKELLLHQGFIEFLLHSIPADRERVPGSRYWLRRLRDPAIRWEFLRGWIESKKDDLRLRAAGLGTELPPERRVSLLNRLAMEDSSEAVRSRALTVLMDVEGPESLRERLERDVESGEIRIRGPALEALRLFHDERNRAFVRKQALSPDQSDAHRAVAVETLAALNLRGAVDDLRHMAMQSPDQRVRQRATEALRTLRTTEAYEQLFTGIRQSPSVVVDDRPRPGFKGIVGMALKTTAVFLLLIANLLLHGLLLLVAGRWVVGTLVFALEGLAFWALEEVYTYEFVGPVLFLVSLGLGFVLPLGKLLRARSTFKLRPRSFRSILCVILFFANFPIFLLVHGLAHLLLGRVARAAGLFATEVAALGAFAIVFYLQPMFYIAGTNLTDYVIYAYMGAGVLLFTVSFAKDWGVVAVRHVVVFRRVEGKRRRKSLLRAVLPTPLASETIIDWAQNGDSVDKKWARGVLLEHAEQVPHEVLVNLLGDEDPETWKFAIRSLARAKNDELVKELTELWEESKPKTRLAIRKVMSNRPSAASVKAFRAWQRNRGFGENLRYQLTRVRFRYSYWPKSLMVAATLGLPLLMLLTYHVVLSYQTEASPLVTFIVRNDHAGIELRVTVANFVANKYPDAVMSPFSDDEKNIIRKARDKAQQRFDQIAKTAQTPSEESAAETGDENIEQVIGPRTVFDELIQVQKEADSCYVRIGLGQSMGIAVYRLEENRALANQLTAENKRRIFANPLWDIKQRLDNTDGGCEPDSIEEHELYDTWTTNGNKGTEKALQALNTIVKEVPEAFSGNSTHGYSLVPPLQGIVNANSKYHAKDALRALTGIYLIRNDVEVQWGKVIDANLHGDASTELEWARRRLVENEKDDVDLDKKGIQKRAAAAFAALGVGLYERAQDEEDSEKRTPMETKAFEFLDRALTLDDNSLDGRAWNVMRALREQNSSPR